MDKLEFNKLQITQQITHVNTLLKDGQSLRTISDNLKMSKTTIRDRFSKIGYQYNSELKAYTEVKDEVIQTPHKVGTKPLAKQEDTRNDIVDKTLDKDTKEDIKQVDSLKSSPQFSIPVKAKSKSDTQAFNIVMKKSLVKTIDRLSKKKGYSRTQMISLLCEMVLDNLEED